MPGLLIGFSAGCFGLATTVRPTVGMKSDLLVGGYQYKIMGDSRNLCNHNVQLL